MKKLLVTLLIMSILVLGACSSGAAKTSEVKSNAPEIKVGDASKKAILVVSFGTSYNDTRAVTIDAIEKAISDEYSNEYDVKRAFTSQIIINKLAKRDGLKINNVDEAMKSLVEEGYGTLIVQPTHVMNGFEYDEMCAAIKPYTENFKVLSFGTPLLTSHEDYAKVVKALGEETSSYINEDTVVAFMGHGTEHFANATYACLESHLQHEINPNYLVGTVEGYPTINEVISDLDTMNAKKVVLFPCMIVAGDHANNDMAGDEEDSWKTMLKLQGFEVESVLKGLGEYEGIRSIFVEHVKEAIERAGK